MTAATGKKTIAVNGTTLPRGYVETIHTNLLLSTIEGEGGRDGGREGGMDGGREGGREGRKEGGREGGREGGLNVIHILIGMFNINPMIPQYLNNNLT